MAHTSGDGVLCILKTQPACRADGITYIGGMTALLSLLSVLVSPFKSNSRLLAENASLRHQVTVLIKMHDQRGVSLTDGDCWFFVRLYHWFPSILNSLVVIKPETLVRWHRAGFRLYWRRKSRSRGRAAAHRHGPSGADVLHEEDEDVVLVLGGVHPAAQIAMLRSIAQGSNLFN